MIRLGFLESRLMIRNPKEYGKMLVFYFLGFCSRFRVQEVSG